VQDIGSIVFVGEIHGCGSLLRLGWPDQQGVEKNAGPHVLEFIGRRHIERLVSAHDELVF